MQIGLKRENNGTNDYSVATFKLLQDFQGKEPVSYTHLVKIPAGGTLQFEMPSDDPDNPDYEKTLVGAGGVVMQIGRAHV